MTADSAARFSATHWSVVLAAARSDEPGATSALDDLCRKYWYPVYAFLRRRGQSPSDAQDLVQGFFADLLSREWLANVSPEKGKFRTFLLACLTHYVNKVHARESGASRSPGMPLLSFDAASAEEQYALEPVEVRDPAVLFERRLALTLIQDVLDRLGCELAAENAAAQFEALCPHLIGEADRGSYADCAIRLGISEGAARVAASRLRGRFRDLLRLEVGRLVDSPGAVDAELRCLADLARV
jgi:RNA polymerase sigma-70 factor (ECF subfamily)